jgi:hypothetical protein
VATTKQPAKEKPAVDVTALRTLIEASIVLAEKQQQLIAEMHALVEGKAGIAARMRIVSDGFLEAWAERYRSKYVWNGTEDSPAAKRLLQRLDPEEIVMRARKYLHSEEEFYLATRHSFRLFARDINRFAREVQGLAFDTSTVTDCRHNPPCRSDQEHTRKRTAEMRG